MNRPEIDTEDFLAASLLLGASTFSLRTIASENGQLLHRLQDYDAFKLAATFAGLLTVPSLHSSCARLEVGVHLAIAVCRGKTSPTEQFVSFVYSTLGKGTCGRFEDPAEDVFVTSIATPRGNFRVLEGVWESAGFHLQRIVDLVDGMPEVPPYDRIRETVYALLSLSELVCNRTGMPRAQLGGPQPIATLPEKIAKQLSGLRRIVLFSQAELEMSGIPMDYLSEFGFDPRDRGHLVGEIIGHTTLERFPLLLRGDEVVFALPTATSAAIRRYVVEQVDRAGVRDTFLKALASNYSRLFSRTPLLGELRDAPVKFGRVGEGIFAEMITEIDDGMFLHLLFILDTLEEFESTGLAGVNPDPTMLAEDIDQCIARACNTVAKTKNLREGLTLLIGCGVGRSVVHYMSGAVRPHWRTEFASAADLYSLSWTPGYKPLSLFRVLHARDKVRTLGVELFNINGLLNLVAWARSLRGHLVPHGELPDGFISQDRQASVLVDQTSIRKLRHQVATAWDMHAELDIHSKWVRVRREAPPLGHLDPSGMTYAEEAWSGINGPRALYMAPNRVWWCEMEVSPDTSRRAAYGRWKTVTTWLERAAPILDSSVAGLPTGPLLWRAAFLGEIVEAADPGAPASYNDARSQIEVHSDQLTHTITLIVGPIFERAIFNVENVAERALVNALVEGALLIAGGEATTERRTELTNAIVTNNSARHSHAFRARHFRDFVQHKLPRSPCSIDEDDTAELKLGLGWRARPQNENPIIEGKDECTSFLNQIVKLVESDLCMHLARFDRVTTLVTILNAHEAAAVDRERWKKSSAAMLALSNDRAVTLEVMSKHDFELNAVSLSTRILTEIALCTCPLTSSQKLGEWDLSRLMAMASMIYHFGGWSDAIRWDAMEPRLRVTPLGDVHGKLDFIETVVSDFAHTTHEVRVTKAVEDYPSYLEELAARQSVHDSFEPEFLAAWEEEFGATIDEIRIFIDVAEDIGLKAEAPIVKIGRKEFLQMVQTQSNLTNNRVVTILDSLCLRARPTWRDIPAGYDEKDIQPWRFRRRLSILRKPMLQIDADENPVLLVSPGLLRDAFIYMVSSYERGDYPNWQLKAKMKTWSGRAADRRGKEFGQSVAKRLQEQGWCVEPEVKITKLLRQGFDEDFGDVDVLAWHKQNGRVLIIECKDVQYRKTFGEIAEQLTDFRGEIRPDGKPDYLLRHLKRVAVISKHLSSVAKYIEFNSVKNVESHIVFKNPVPMRFALQQLSEKLTIHTFDQLIAI